MSTKSPLRLFYEDELERKISDRTWSRIKRQLGIREPIVFGNKAEMKAIVQAYAYLRKAYSNRLITTDIVKRFLDIKNLLAQQTFMQCTGREIYDVAQKLSPRPSDSTLYRWGEEIGLRFSVNRTYTEAEVNKWIEKIASNPRYKYCSSKLRRTQDNGQNQRTA